MRGQQHSFSTHERVFLWKFWDRKCLDLRGSRTPNLRIHAKCSNLVSYQGQTFAVSCVFEYWLWQCRYFLIKLTYMNIYIYTLITSFCAFQCMNKQKSWSKDGDEYVHFIHISSYIWKWTAFNSYAYYILRNVCTVTGIYIPATNWSITVWFVAFLPY